MARRGKGKRSRRVATPAVAALAGLPPGADLLAAIAGLDLSSLTGYDLPLVLRAVYRLGNHTRALLLDVVAEIMRRKDPDGTGSGSWDAVGVHEVRAALAMSRTAANSLNHLAQDLHERLPQVLDAMRDGRLDQPRARVFSSWTGLLSEAHARAVVDALLPVAPRLTTGELIDEIRRVAIELDPDFARREHDHGRSQRRVRGAIDRDGTGHITAEGLTAEQIAASCDRLDAIGWHLKRAGHPGRLDHIRADVFAGLLTGEFAGLTDEQLLEKLLATMPSASEAGTSTSEGPLAPESPAGSAAAAASSGSATSEAATDHDGAGDAPAEPGGEAGEEDAHGEAGQPGDDVDELDRPEQAGTDLLDPEQAEADRFAGSSGESSGDLPGPVTPVRGDMDDDGGPANAEDGDSPNDGGEPSPEGSPPGTPSGSSAPGPGQGPLRTASREHESSLEHEASREQETSRAQETSGVRLHRRGLRLWVGLGTVAGRDRRAGELLGWSLVHAELARRIAAAPGASWWYVLGDDNEQPVQVGPIRRRPQRRWWDGEAAPCRGVEVWLQVTAAELAGLVAKPPPGWERIIADIAHRVANAPDGAPNGDPADRFPSVGLRRFLAIRDRRCGFPGCRVPSHRTDVDHVVDYARGGPTVDANLTHLCRPDHELKTKYGWRVDHLAPGRLRWTSPLGHVYERPAPRGPARTHPPMPHPAGPEHDWFRLWTDATYVGDEDLSPTACLTSDERRFAPESRSAFATEGAADRGPGRQPGSGPQPGPEPRSGPAPAHAATVSVPSGGDDVIPF
jgi:hypothetical protein